MELAIVSDSHIPSREQRIPTAFRGRIERAAHVIHAGDFDAEGTLANMRALASRLTAVSGNMDPRIGLPSVTTVELGGVEFVVTHGTGPTRGYKQRVADTVREHADDAVGVAGHTHELLDTVHDGVRILNPGSVTGAAPASRATMFTATVENGVIDIDRHEH
jgi:putative phosphoesterase